MKRTTLSLGPERAEQLRALALHLDQPITRIMEDMIDEALAKHKIAVDPLSHVKVEEGHFGGVNVTTEAFGKLRLTHNEAIWVVQHLGMAADKSGNGRFRAAIDLVIVETYRQGRGVVISVNCKRFSMTPRIAIELAKRIEDSLGEAP